MKKKKLKKEISNLKEQLRIAEEWLNKVVLEPSSSDAIAIRNNVEFSAAIEKGIWYGNSDYKSTPTGVGVMEQIIIPNSDYRSMPTGVGVIVKPPTYAPNIADKDGKFRNDKSPSS